MRVAPLGAWFTDDTEAAAREARLSAEVTHSHGEGIAGAIAVAVAAAHAYRLRGSSAPVEPREFIECVLQWVPEGDVRAGIDLSRSFDRNAPSDAVSAQLGCGAKVTAADTVPFALWMASRFLDDYEEALWRTAASFGDVDTNLAIVGGIVASSTPSCSRTSSPRSSCPTPYASVRKKANAGATRTPSAWK